MMVNGPVTVRGIVFEQIVFGGPLETWEEFDQLGMT